MLSANSRSRKRSATAAGTEKSVSFAGRLTKKIKVSGSLESSIEASPLTQEIPDPAYDSDSADSIESQVTVALEMDMPAAPVTQATEKDIESESIEIELEIEEKSDSDCLSTSEDYESDFSTTSMTAQAEHEGLKALNNADADIKEEEEEEKFTAEEADLHPVRRTVRKSILLERDSLFHNDPDRAVDRDKALRDFRGKAIKVYAQAIHHELLPKLAAYFAAVKAGNNNMFSPGLNNPQTFVTNFIRLVCRIYKQPDVIKVLEDGDNERLADDKAILQKLANQENAVVTEAAKYANDPNPVRFLKKFMIIHNKSILMDRKKMSADHGPKVLALVLYKIARLFMEKDSKLLPVKKGTPNLGEELATLFLNHAEELGLKKAAERREAYQKEAEKSAVQISLRPRR